MGRISTLLLMLLLVSLVGMPAAATQDGAADPVAVTAHAPDRPELPECHAFLHGSGPLATAARSGSAPEPPQPVASITPAGWLVAGAIGPARILPLAPRSGGVPPYALTQRLRL